MFDQEKLTQTYRFFRCSKYGLGLSFFLLIGFSLFSQKANPAALIFLCVLILFLMYIVSNVQMALQNKKKQAWGWATLLALLSLPTPLLPFSFLSLRELSHQENKRAYLKDCKETPKAERSRMRIALTVSIFVSALYGTYLFWVFLDQQPIFYHVAKGKLEFNVAPHLSIKELYALGAECNTYGNTKCSIAVFAKILEKDPGDKMALANLAMAQTHLGDHTSAIKNYRQAIDMGVTTYDVYTFYGDSLNELGEKRMALLYYRKAFDLNPQLIDVAKKLGYLLFEMERYQEAFEIIDQFIERHPEAVEELEELHEQLRSQI